MSTWFKTSIPFLTVLLLMTFTQPGLGTPCQADACSRLYYERMGLNGVMKGSNPPYCQLITDYEFCLNNTAKECVGNFVYHSIKTFAANERISKNCSRFPGTSRPSGVEEPRCHHLAENLPNPEYRYCSLFGSRHLRTFNTSFETCARSGAFPLFDSQHLVVQITHSSLSSSANALTKVTVIAKECGSCTQRKHYEASSDNQKLSLAFVDGTTFGGDPMDKAVEIKAQNDSHIEIYAHHISTKVVISRQGPFLAVSLRVPEFINREYGGDIEQLCTHGCSGGKTMQTKEALANPLAFTKCHGILLQTPLKIATERCARAGVSDAYFDACVFDLMTTGNELLVSMAVDAQNEMARMHPRYVTHFCTGRTNLSVYDYLAGYEFSNCVKPTTPQAPAAALSLSSTFSTVVSRFTFLFLLVLCHNVVQKLFL